MIGKLISAQAAFPADELRKNGGGDPVGRQFCLGCDQPFIHGFHRTASGGQMPFKPVTVYVYDSRHDDIAAQIDAGGLRGCGDAPFGNSQRTGL